MELVVTRPEDDLDADAIMVHGDEKIEWHYSTFKKQQKGQSNINVLFNELNAYWAQLPKDQQDQIFSVYSRIYRALRTADNTKALSRQLVPLFTELYELHDLGDIDHWIRFHSGIRIPDKIKETFDESEDSTQTRQKTYTREDYQKLLVLVLALRAAVPVWGEVISITERTKIYGTDWKEYAVFQMIGRSKLMTCDAMLKLRAYVDAYIPRNKLQESAILDGCGSEDFPEWMLAVIAVRRVAIGDVRNDFNPESHLVSSIHSYIHAKLSPSESNFMGNIRPKNPERDTSGDDSAKLSHLEKYKVREELSEGDVAIIVHYAKLPARMLDKVMHEQSKISGRVRTQEEMAHMHQLLDASLRSVRALASAHVQPVQRTIMQLVLRAAIPPRGIQYLPRDEFLGCMAVVQAILWAPRPREHDKDYSHKELAGLVSAMADMRSGDEVEASMPSHGRIPKLYQEELAELFPYPYRTSGKQQKEGGKTINAAVQNIDNMVKQFDSCGWRLTLPSEWVAEINQDALNRNYSVPYEIRGQLAALVIDVERGLL